ncbi:hypothetical protein [Mycolicibacterium hippocampi]|nr:hypothetical protein [Mycolicibacterium hippocampi]
MRTRGVPTAGHDVGRCAGHDAGNRTAVGPTGTDRMGRDCGT